MSSRIALVLGSGPRVGQAIINKFVAAGYKVASVARTVVEENNNGVLRIKADLADPTSIEEIFDRVQTHWGVPDVVIYNAWAMTLTRSNPLSASIQEVQDSLNVNTVSAYAAASIAYQRNNKVTFLYTGNALGTGLVDPNITTLGIGKSASAHWIRAAAKSEVLRPAKFYFCDQRTLEGGPCYTGLNGQAHADLYLRLAEQKEQGDPLVIFRAGPGV